MQALYDKGKIRSFSSMISIIFLANFVVYGIVGMASGIIGIIGVDLNLLSCFQTFAILSLGISVYLSTHILSLWVSQTFSFSWNIYISAFIVCVLRFPQRSLLSRCSYSWPQSLLDNDRFLWSRILPHCSWLRLAIRVYI